jgi:ankyrin repeat protein
MERQTSFRLGALEKLKSFRGMDNFRGKNKDSPGKRGDTALHLAARAGSVSHVQKILAEFDRELVGELAARPNQDGETALYVAAEKGHTEVVREILKVSDVQTAGIKASNSFDAFHIAAKQGHLGKSFSLLRVVYCSDNSLRSKSVK